MSYFLVTGCAWFIGARVCQLLLEPEPEVVVVDDLNPVYDVRLKEWRLTRLVAKLGFRFRRPDFAGLEEMACLGSAPFAAVVHLAGQAGVRRRVVDPWSCYTANLTGTLNVLDRCRSSGVPKLVLASSSSVYGETAGRACGEEDDTSRPRSPYAALKKAVEEVCRANHHIWGLDPSVLRFFTHPDHTAAGIVAAFRPVGYAATNPGSDRPVALLRLVRLIEERVGRASSPGPEFRVGELAREAA